jgi:glucose/arabinose dehydrogenase
LRNRFQLLRSLFAVPLLVASLMTVQTVQAAPPTGFVETTVATGLGIPTSIAFTPDGSMLVTSKVGRLFLIRHGTRTTALDVHASTCTHGEEGLESVTPSPSFASDHLIFTYRTHPSGSACVNQVASYTLSAGGAASGPHVLLDNIHDALPQGFHNGGNLKFGRDGNLYVTVGDGFCTIGCDASNRAAQHLNTLNGKVLRITPGGGIPAGNPFAGAGSARCARTGSTSAASCQEVYAYGFRNPFGLAVDPNTGAIRVNDTGRNTWEEIDNLTAGANYGWNRREGPCAVNSTTNCGTVPGLTNPIFAYAHTASRDGAITGGAFVPNGAWSPAFNGRYLYNDFLDGDISTLTCSGGHCTSATFESGFGSGAGHASLIAAEFGPSTSGSPQAYYFSLYTGQVHEIAFH